MSKAAGIFVAGTDTEVGKTMVSAALVLSLQQAGVDAGYVKPVASGCREREGRLVSEDVLLVQRLCGLDDPWEQMGPVCLEDPVCPLVAEKLAGNKEMVEPVRWLLPAVLEAHAFTVVEGMGGVMVPLSKRLMLLDLMVDLGLPVLLVARPGLGTINHSLLTIDAMRNRGLKPLGFIFVGPRPDQAEDPAIPHNAGVINEFSAIPYLGTLPWLEDMEAEDLRRATQEHLDLAPVLDLAGSLVEE